MGILLILKKNAEDNQLMYFWAYLQFLIFMNQHWSFLSQIKSGDSFLKAALQNSLSYTLCDAIENICFY